MACKQLLHKFGEKVKIISGRNNQKSFLNKAEPKLGLEEWVEL